MLPIGRRIAAEDAERRLPRVTIGQKEPVGIDRSQYIDTCSANREARPALISSISARRQMLPDKLARRLPQQSAAMRERTRIGYDHQASPSSVRPERTRYAWDLMEINAQQAVLVYVQSETWNALRSSRGVDRMPQPTIHHSQTHSPIRSMPGSVPFSFST
ncbi:hypothetical protein EMEDMD4_370112 [Sinorhizobium medicae]|uniref:Uncharacterized protein n=1 Tax=Sinorhizobium medicae TaxID=110321 RepID=A0A508WXS9_9HYPH|nr:hypothetical protein EMEDMD4_370112 [Sinorhizobium medicae]